MSKSLVSAEELANLDKAIDSDENLPADFKNQPMLREVLRSGLWLVGELKKLECDPTLIVQFQYTHGKCSFGHDPWEQAEILLSEYINNTYTVAEN